MSSFHDRIKENGKEFENRNGGNEGYQKLMSHKIRRTFAFHLLWSQIMNREIK